MQPGRAVEDADPVPRDGVGVQPLGLGPQAGGAITWRQRLVETYPARDGENKLIVEQLFPGAAARVFVAIDELALPEEFFKASARVAAEPAPKKAAGRKSAAAKAPAADEDDGIGDL
jgi:hypothetical protein